MKSEAITTALACCMITVLCVHASCSAVSAAPLLDKKRFDPAPALHGSQRYPAVSHAQGIYLLAWQEGSHGWGPPADTQIRAVRVSEDGATIDKESFVVSAAADFQEKPVIATDGNIFLVVWQDMRNGRDYDIFAARVTPEGKVLDPAGIGVLVARHNQCKPGVSYDGKNFVVVWMDNRDLEQSYHVRIARISPEGKMLDPEGVAVAGHGNEYRQDDALRGVPVYTMPRIACSYGECLVGWIQKIKMTDAWDEYPGFRYVKTRPQVSRDDKVVRLGELPVSLPHYRDKARSPALSMAANGDRVVTTYSGVRGKGSGDFFIAAGVFKAGRDPLHVILRPLKQGVQDSESTIPYRDGFLVCWAEGDRSDVRKPIRYSLKAAYLDRNNNAEFFDLLDWQETYVGYPSISVGSVGALLVYEQLDEEHGMRIVAQTMDISPKESPTTK